jgi:hypothetical protein
MLCVPGQTTHSLFGALSLHGICNSISHAPTYMVLLLLGVNRPFFHSCCNKITAIRESRNVHRGCSYLWIQTILEALVQEASSWQVRELPPEGSTSGVLLQFPAASV